MSDKKTYWIHDGADTHALVTGAEERDRYVGAGWSETDEPADGFVMVWRHGIATPGRTSVDALREVYEPAGWLAGPPADGVNPFEAVATETAAPAEAAATETAAAETAAPAETRTRTKPSKAAARGAEEE